MTARARAEMRTVSSYIAAAALRGLQFMELGEKRLIVLCAIGRTIICRFGHPLQSQAKVLDLLGRRARHATGTERTMLYALRRTQM